MKAQARGNKPQDNFKGDKMERVTTYQTFERVLNIVKKENGIKNIPQKHKANFLAGALKMKPHEIIMDVNANMLPTRHVVHFCLDRGISIDKMIYAS